MYNSTFLWKRVGFEIKPTCIYNVLQTTLQPWKKLCGSACTWPLLSDKFDLEQHWDLQFSLQYTCLFELMYFWVLLSSEEELRVLSKENEGRRENLVLTKPLIPVFPFFIAGSKIRWVYFSLSNVYLTQQRCRHSTK